MADVHDATEVEESGPIEKLDKVGRTAVKVAASTIVATSIAAALGEPPHAELITLPEPTPIVQVFQGFEEDVVPDEDEEQDESSSFWRRLLKVLKYLLVALLLATSIALGVLKGCAGIAGGLVLPASDDQQEEQAQAAPAQTEDERGVAY